jgi:hypothetical protein
MAEFFLLLPGFLIEKKTHYACALFSSQIVDESLSMLPVLGFMHD